MDAGRPASRCAARTDSDVEYRPPPSPGAGRRARGPEGLDLGRGPHETEDLMARPAELADELGSDETAGPCDEDPHRVPPDGKARAVHPIGGGRCERETSAPSDGPRLNALDLREMVCEELPRVPFVPAVVKLARRRPDVHAHGIGVVRAHRIPQDGEPRILLWEASVKAGPPLPTVRRAIHRHRPARRYAVEIPLERDGVKRLRLVRVRGHWKAERTRQALLDRRPPAQGG